MNGRQQIAIFADFNGTITNRDMLAALLESYDRKTLLASITQARNNGFLSLRERIAREAAAITCSLMEAEARLRTLVTIDPAFPPFYRRCLSEGVSLVVVSSGIESLITRILGRYGIDTIPVFANDVDPRPDGWRVKFRDSTAEGNAKRPYVEAAARDGYRTVIVGDDESDFGMAIAADVRFAKCGTPLETFLQECGLAFHAIESFDDVYERLALEHLLAH